MDSSVYNVHVVMEMAISICLIAGDLDARREGHDFFNRNNILLFINKNLLLP